MDQQHKVIVALAHKRAARELTLIATKENALASPIGSLVPTALNFTTSALPSAIYTTINDLEAMQPLAPGHAFHLSQVVATQEQDSLPLEFEELEANKLPFVVLEAHKLLFKESEALKLTFKELEAHELPFNHVYLDEGESEVDPDNPALLNDHYPSELEAGETTMANVGRNWRGSQE